MLFYKLVINHSFQKCTPRWWRVETTSPCRRWVGNLAGLMQLGLCAVGYKILTIAIWRSFDRVWIPCHVPNCKLDYSITYNLRWYYILLDTLYLFILDNLDVCGCHIWKSQPVMSGPLGIWNGLEVTTKAQIFVELWPTIHTTSPILCLLSGASRWIWHSTCGPAAKQKMLTGINCTSITIKHVDWDLCFLTRTQTCFWWLHIFVRHWRIVVSFCRDFWVWNSAWNLHNLISQCLCDIWCTEFLWRNLSWMYVTPPVLLGSAVAWNLTMVSTRNLIGFKFQVAMDQVVCRIDGMIWVVLEAMEQLHTPWWYCVHHQNSLWYMFCEEDNHIW